MRNTLAILAHIRYEHDTKACHAEMHCGLCTADGTPAEVARYLAKHLATCKDCNNEYLRLTRLG
jgi:hypothetical protein